MPSISSLIVSGAGPVGYVLRTIESFCDEMKETKDACKCLHSRLVEISHELEKLLESKSPTERPPPHVLDTFVAIVAQFLRYLERCRNKGIVFRVVEHGAITSKLLSLYEDVTALSDAVQVPTIQDWREQFDEDLSVAKMIMVAVVRDNAMVLRDLQDPRAQREALLTLRFEIEQRPGRHSEEVKRLMLSMMTTVIAVTKTQSPAPNIIVPPWFFSVCEIEVEPNPFACGSFGTVHHGVWGPGTKVVVKRFLVDGKVVGVREQARIEKEINIWHQLNHPNVVKMFGASHVSLPPFVVCEDAVNGDLGSFLACPGNKREAWRLLHQAALGLDYIHKNGVVHVDLKLNNILVGADGMAKLADFGLSSMRTYSTLSKAPSTCSSVSVNVRWHAPERLGQQPTFASDVYSLAMCMIEAATEEPPFSFLQDIAVREKLKGGVIPPRPKEMNAREWGLVVAMTTSGPAKRLPLGRVIERLQGLGDFNAIPKVEESLHFEDSSEIATDTTNYSQAGGIDSSDSKAQATTAPCEINVDAAPRCRGEGTQGERSDSSTPKLASSESTPIGFKSSSAISRPPLVVSPELPATSPTIRTADSPRPSPKRTVVRPSSAVIHTKPPTSSEKLSVADRIQKLNAASIKNTAPPELRKDSGATTLGAAAVNGGRRNQRISPKRRSASNKSSTWQVKDVPPPPKTSSESSVEKPSGVAGLVAFFQREKTKNEAQPSSDHARSVQVKGRKPVLPAASVPAPPQKHKNFSVYGRVRVGGRPTMASRF